MYDVGMSYAGCTHEGAGQHSRWAVGLLAHREARARAREVSTSGWYQP